MSEQEQSQAVEETTQSLLNLNLTNPDEDVIGIVSVSTSPSSDNDSSSTSSASVGGSMVDSLHYQIEELKGISVYYIILFYFTPHCLFTCFQMKFLQGRLRLEICRNKCNRLLIQQAVQLQWRSHRFTSTLPTEMVLFLDSCIMTDIRMSSTTPMEVVALK